MAETENSVDRNLADSIAMLEQILEVMPHDADALQAVYSAYQQLGEDSRAFEYLNRIIDLYTGNEDASLLPFIRQELARYEERFPSEVAAQHARLRLVIESESPTIEKMDPVPQKAGNQKKKEADISEELALAWKLYEEDQLSQEEYSSVLHDLTEVSSKEVDVPISVLHVLNDRGFTQMNRIMNFLSSRSGVPCITLTHFEMNEELASVLPLEIVTRDGAIPFAFLGNDLLIAVLNPFNHLLVDKVESETGRRSHSFLVEAEDYDLALNKLRTLASKSSFPGQP